MRGYNQEPMVQVAIFERPEDYPQGYAVRRLYIYTGKRSVPAAEPAKYFDTRELARAWVKKKHPTLARLPRYVRDDRTLCDTYI